RHRVDGLAVHRDDGVTGLEPRQAGRRAGPHRLHAGAGVVASIGAAHAQPRHHHPPVDVDAAGGGAGDLDRHRVDAVVSGVGGEADDPLVLVEEGGALGDWRVVVDVEAYEVLQHLPRGGRCIHAEGIDGGGGAAAAGGGR